MSDETENQVGYPEDTANHIAELREKIGKITGLEIMQLRGIAPEISSLPTDQHVEAYLGKPITDKEKFAYAGYKNGKIILFPRFFKKDEEQQLKILFHEFSHPLRAYLAGDPELLGILENFPTELDSEATLIFSQLKDKTENDETKKEFAWREQNERSTEILGAFLRSQTPEDLVKILLAQAKDQTKTNRFDNEDFRQKCADIFPKLAEIKTKLQNQSATTIRRTIAAYEEQNLGEFEFDDFFSDYSGSGSMVNQNLENELLKSNVGPQKGFLQEIRENAAAIKRFFRV